MKRLSFRAILLGIAGLLILLALWQLGAMTGLLSRAFVASPSATYLALWDGLVRGVMLSQTYDTITRMVQGWFLASIAGIAIGSIIGISRTARAYMQPSLEFLRPLPASAIIPPAIALLGLGPKMALAVITFGSLWPTLLATIQGFALVEQTLTDVARTLHLSRGGFVWKVGLPNAMPDIIAGMRLSATVALILTIVCEMLAGQNGLGTAILLAARSYHSADLFAGLTLLGFVGLATSYVLALGERVIVPWQD